MGDTGSNAAPRRLAPDVDATEPTPDPPEIVVYWRPSCGFCSRLLRQLDGAGVAHRRVNIWEDAAGAATVRSVAGGNETVPTVVIGSVGLVNPDLRSVVAAAAEAGA